MEYFEGIGEAAFYGPKIDVQMKMGAPQGGEESIASVQLDILSAERFQLKFVNSQGKSELPWIIHRAPLGSHERFVALLLEYFDGQLPGWLSPIQVYLMPVAAEDASAAHALARKLRAQGLRAQVDEQSGRLNKRLVFAHRLRPFSRVIIGRRERESGELVLQLRDSKRVLSLLDLPRELKKLCQAPSD